MKSQLRLKDSYVSNGRWVVVRKLNLLALNLDILYKMSEDEP
jgi:hypothetical protein